ncbi:endonuclease/exonuclease/phosphatase family protein [Microcoleus sp. FACHB-672]|uniref:endonuclease/exonuclease/phosphatase family protein n=1 Tax=Microcoleus sp. FACHB-672 TaxID=2692825 RepID=UPI001689A31B|nr:endonuclease/exonuclease/phosphatase family protein [Microcoleus sp. FACHB-672]MBD2041001.1 endonuclease/exonuclease/phosphatase family protein [Microcoleus sp. FACHB-672]
MARCAVLLKSGAQPERMKLRLGKELTPQKFNRKKRSWVDDVDAGVNITATQLTLVTYNVWFSEYYRKKRCEALLQIIHDCDADVISLQEVTPSFLKILLQQEWVRNSYYISDAIGVTVTPYGVLFLSKIPISRLSFYKLPSSMNRTLLISELCVNGEVIKIATVHLESQKSSAPLRAEQLSLIFPLIQDSPHALLMGDFNFCSSWKSENDNIDSSYQDMWATLRTEEAGYTEDTDINIMRLERKGKERKVRFDRIFIRSDSLTWQPESIEMLGKTPISPKHPKVFPSDHFGLAGSLLSQSSPIKT